MIHLLSKKKKKNLINLQQNIQACQNWTRIFRNLLPPSLSAELFLGLSKAQAYWLSMNYRWPLGTQTPSNTEARKGSSHSWVEVGSKLKLRNSQRGTRRSPGKQVKKGGELEEDPESPVRSRGVSWAGTSVRRLTGSHVHFPRISWQTVLETDNEVKDERGSPDMNALKERSRAWQGLEFLQCLRGCHR